MRTPSQRQIFFKKPRSNIYRMLFWILLITISVFIFSSIRTGAMRSPFAPTLTPTRTGNSFAMEGDAQFNAGNLNEALTAYQEAVRVESGNAEIWIKLARIQAYTSSLLTTDTEKETRLKEALVSAKKGVELAPESSSAHATLAFVLDWNAGVLIYSPDPAKTNEGQSLLTQAEQEAIRALTLDNTNTLALAYYAEILTDQQKLTQAQSYIEQAIQRDESLMDVHRVYAYLLESLGLYRQAIEEYKKAIEITPNLTFLYLRVGAIYRHLQDYENSLSYAARAAALNKQLNIKDPIPFLSIAKTYSQQGEFFIAGQNVLKALSFSPGDADIYGQLGIVYFKSRNYEGSILPLKCAVRGCTAAESCEARNGCDDGDPGTEIKGLSLSPSSVYYYTIYGSVLSALSTKKQNYCTEAMDVFATVRATFSNDATVSGIVQAGETICRDLESSINNVTTGTATPIPANVMTPTTSKTSP
jgi:tetratricopeptide (TPR) repeat protein